MAQVITIAGERLFAIKAQNNQQLDIDTFIFANVPGQDSSADIDRNESVPPVGQQVHTQIVQQVGRVNDNVVIYSTVLDSLTGPFDFNWVGLYSSVNQTLVAISHIPNVSKTITVPGAAGNTLNRNFGIEYSGIADLTGITVDPETWQLDYTSRLNGMDELTRQLAADMNGKDWFIGDGFKVGPRSTLNSFKVTAGAGYVSGLRVELATDHILTLSSYPKFIYVDAWFDGTSESVWKGKIAFTVTNADMDDYIDVNGKQHYVSKIAIIKSSEDVEDLRVISELNKRIIPPILGRDTRFEIHDNKASLRYGISDPLPLDDPRNHFRGLNSSKDAWGDENNIGVGSISFGRNGASYAYLSATFGHDAITYGVASLAGGAGTATGNPDDPDDSSSQNPVGYGYCAFAYGKDSNAQGRISHAIGEKCQALSSHSNAQGSECVAGPGLITHPNDKGQDGIVSAGNYAIAMGHRCQAFGDSAIAIGVALNAYNGAQVFGSGINTGSPLTNSTPNSIALGRNVDVATVKIFAGPGINGGYGKLGLNTNEEPEDLIEGHVRGGDTVSLIADKASPEEIKIRLGCKISDLNRGIFDIGYTHPNSGQPHGVTTLYQNEVPFATISESGVLTLVKELMLSSSGVYVDGERVVGAKQGSISDATGPNNTDVINEILSALREHGLIDNVSS